MGTVYLKPKSNQIGQTFFFYRIPNLVDGYHAITLEEKKYQSHNFPIKRHYLIQFTLFNIQFRMGLFCARVCHPDSDRSQTRKRIPKKRRIVDNFVGDDE